MTADVLTRGDGAADQTESSRDLLANKLKSLKHSKVTPTASAPIDVNDGVAADKKVPAEASASPIPPLQNLPPPSPLTLSELESASFMAPRKRIVSPSSMQRWSSAKAFDEILGFMMACNTAVIGKKLRDPIAISPAVSAILGILDEVEATVEAVPAESEGTSRFGNPAFRTFYARVKDNSRKWHGTIPSLEALRSSEAGGPDAIGEIEVYFYESFGNAKRIDYGSGMELNFACWLVCLVKLGILRLEEEASSIVLRVFWRYVEVMRRIQSTYWLEPAGSHGVWGLDDYHFLPFVFGSAQLVSHRIFRPKSIHDEEILNDFSADYMYFACIRFINSIKTASLRWHSPMLDDISSVKTWSKVNEGMLKMYKAEVLLKLPIAQHVYFGSLLSFPQEGDDEQEERELQEAVEKGGVVHTDELGRTHVHAAEPDSSGVAQAANGWGDCCGIPIPSAFGAAKEERDKLRGAGGLRFNGAGGGIRRIPFD